MEVNALMQSPPAPRTDRSGEERSQALSDKRRALNADVIARADEAKARSADRLAEVREAVARVLGANTRLSISRSDGTFDFVYRAIDVDTGEIINEWPQEVFVDLIRGVRDDVRTDVDAGLWLDRVA